MRLSIMVLLLGLAAPARADAVTAVGAGMFLPPSGGALGAAVHVDAAYEWTPRRVALAPGLRWSGYLGPQEAVVGLASLRVSLPLSIARPYLFTGVGLAHHEELSLAIQTGVGLLFALASHVAVGGEASYAQLGRGSFRAVYLGPTLQLSVAAIPMERD